MARTVLQIRCSEETKRRFKEFVVRNGFKTYEQALVELLKKAEDYSWFRRGRAY